MAGVDVGGGGGKGKRSLDSEINMIPFIDLLMVTISFLLITAVWSHMARINADAQVPGPPRPDQEQDKVEPEKVLHIEMRTPDKFVLSWKQGAQVVNSLEVARKDNLVEKGGSKSISYGTAYATADDLKANKCKQDDSLAATICREWTNTGSHKDPSDHKVDQVVLHTDNETQYVYIIGVIDAIYSTQRDEKLADNRSAKRPAFNVTFAVN